MFPAFTAITTHQFLSSSRRNRQSYSPSRRPLPVASRQVLPSEHPLGCRCAEETAREAQATSELMMDLLIALRSANLA